MLSVLLFTIPPAAAADAQQRKDRICTGVALFPFLKPSIEQIAGEGIGIIDPAPAIARQVARVLPSSITARDIPNRYFTSGDPDSFRALLHDLNRRGCACRRCASIDQEQKARLCIETIENDVEHAFHRMVGRGLPESSLRANLGHCGTFTSHS